MPVAVTYPGVYVEELPSGNHTITGVATAITAFVGRAYSGPVNEPVNLFSFADYERFFGGLAPGYPMSFTVYDYFLNGGSQAVVVRVFEPITKYSRDEWDEQDVPGAIEDAKADAAKAKDGPDALKALQDHADNAPTDKPAQKQALQDLAALAASEVPNPPTGSPIVPVLEAIEYYSAEYPTGRAGILSQDAVTKDRDDTTAAMLKAVDDTIATNPKATPAEVAKGVQAAAAKVEAQPAKGVAAWVATTATALAADKQKNPDAATLKTSLVAAVQSQAPTLTVLPLEARDPGAWGRGLTVAIDRKGIDALHPVDPSFVQKYGRYGLTPADLFNLTVSYQSHDGQATSERFLNLSAKNGKSAAAPSRYDRVLAGQSMLVQAPDEVDFSALGSIGEAVIPFDDKTGADSNPITADVLILGGATKQGLYALNKADLFNLLCVPPDTLDGNTDPSVYAAAAVLCEERRAFLIMDPPVEWAALAHSGQASQIQPTDPLLGVGGDVGKYAAVYFPRVRKQDPTMNGQPGVFPACGIIAGIMATTDVQRGVWKAPAGQNAGINGILGLEVGLSNAESGELNPLGINCLRSFPVIGPVVWGARTLRGADVLSDDYKYVSVRRLTNYIEESLYRGTQWSVFEPNDERLWSSLRLSVGTFMADLSRQGAFYSYTVACDSKTTTPSDIAQGIVRVRISFAPVDPAEFVVLTIQQSASSAS